jgi:hypothetical protein
MRTPRKTASSTAAVPLRSHRPGRRSSRAAGPRGALLSGCSLAVAALAVALLLGGPKQALSTGTSSSELIGLYLYNFLLFVDWPDEAHRKRHTLEIGILAPAGDGRRRPLAGIEGKRIRGKTVVVRRVLRTADLDPGWQVLFVESASKGVVLEALDRLGGAPCLTASDMPGFAGLGGMVEFLAPREIATSVHATETARPAPRFRINLESVLDAGLKIRSRLLRLSEITGGIPNGTPVER